MTHAPLAASMQAYLAATYPFIYGVADPQNHPSERQTFFAADTLANLAFQRDATPQAPARDVDLAAISLFYVIDARQRPRPLPSLVAMQQAGYSKTLIHTLLLGPTGLGSPSALHIAKVFVATLMTSGSLFAQDSDHAQKLLRGMHTADFDSAVIAVLNMIASCNLPHLVRPLLALDSSPGHRADCANVPADAEASDHAISWTRGAKAG